MQKGNDLRRVLLDSASRLTQPSVETAMAYRFRIDHMIDEVDNAFLARPDLQSLIGSGNIDVMKNNHRNHALFMSSLLLAFQPAVLFDTVHWVLRTYRSRGFSLSYWDVQLQAWLDAMKQELTLDHYRAIEPFYRWMATNINALDKERDHAFDNEDHADRIQ